MTAVPLAEAARLLGKPERTVRRWAASGRLPATRTADGWLVELQIDEHGQVAATDRTNGHSNGRAATSTAATGGQLATVPVTLLHELMGKAELAAYWQGRASVLEARVQQLEGQLALPAPSEKPLAGSSRNGTLETSVEPSEPKRPWWRLW